MADRDLRRTGFLAKAGWGEATCLPLAGDASQRAYFRLRHGTDTAILMDAPADTGKALTAFIDIDQHLIALGLSAPQLLAQDIAEGFLLLEDFGDDVFTTLLQAAPACQNSLYSSATDVLVTLFRHPAPARLARLDPAAMARIARLAVDWYIPGATGFAGGDAILPALAGAAERLIHGPDVLMLRDYHAGNMIWLPNRTGPARVGLLDFQDAMAAHPAYDLVSVLQDARRDVPKALEAAMIARFCTATHLNRHDFSAAYALLGAQRALRILGVFARLSMQSGKPGYLVHAPRVWQQLQRNLAHPALSQLANLCDRLLPEPTPARLNRIKELCGTIQTP